VLLNFPASFGAGAQGCSAADIINLIIPYFNKYPIQGTKMLDYIGFCKVAELMQTKAHLTDEGLEEIRQIKCVMNTGRNLKED
jgi:hypothetical protein